MSVPYRVLEDLAAFNDAISDRFDFQTIALIATSRDTASSRFVRDNFAFIDELTGPQILAITLDEPEGGYWRYLQESGSHDRREPRSVHTFLAERNRAATSKRALFRETLDYSQQSAPPSGIYLRQLLERMGLPPIAETFILLFAVPEHDHDIWNAQAYAMIELPGDFNDPYHWREIFTEIFGAILAVHDAFGHGNIRDVYDRWVYLQHRIGRFRRAEIFRPAPIPFAHFAALYRNRDDRDIKIIMTLHGINTHGKWQKEITPWIGMQGWIHFPIDYAKYPANVFDFLMFLAGRAPERLLQTFRDAYGHIKTDQEYSRYSDHISVIAHSFGTKVVADSLSRYEHLMNFEKFIFCGSIVNADFNWAPHITADRVDGLLNEYGSHDTWTRIYGALRLQRIAGVLGFQGAPPAVLNRHRHVSHSDWFNRLHFNEVWAPYLRTGVA